MTACEGGKEAAAAPLRAALPTEKVDASVFRGRLRAWSFTLMPMPSDTPERPNEQQLNGGRPKWSLSEAARRTGVSRATLLRRIDAGKLPGAIKTDEGWSIGVDDLIGAGIIPDKPSPPDPVHDHDHHPPTVDRITELEQQLALARVQLAAAEQIAVERERVIQAQAATLRMLESGQPTHQPPSQPPASDQRQSAAVPIHERSPEPGNPLTWLRRRILG